MLLGVTSEETDVLNILHLTKMHLTKLDLPYGQLDTRAPFPREESRRVGKMFSNRDTVQMPAESTKPTLHNNQEGSQTRASRRDSDTLLD